MTNSPPRPLSSHPLQAIGRDDCDRRLGQQRGRLRPGSAWCGTGRAEHANPTDRCPAGSCVLRPRRTGTQKQKQNFSFFGEGGGIPTRTSQPVQCRPAPPCMHAWYPILCCLLIGDSDPILRPICVFRLTWARGAWPPSTAGPPPPRYGSFDMSWGHFSRISHAFLSTKPP